MGPTSVIQAVFIITPSFPETVHAACTLAAEVLVHLDLPVQKLDGLLVVFAITVVQDGRLPDGHSDDRTVLVGTWRPEPIPGLRWSKQN